MRSVEDENLVFKSKTHVIVLDDYQGFPGILTEGHINSTKQDFDDLELLQGKLNPDRKGRNNVSFFPLCYIDRTLDYFRTCREDDN